MLNYNLSLYFSKYKPPIMFKYKSRRLYLFKFCPPAIELNNIPPMMFKYINPQINIKCVNPSTRKFTVYWNISDNT